MSNCNVIVGSNLDNGHALALSSLIHALARSETYALGRLVAGNGKPPVVVTLAPIIEDEGFEGLAEVQIPFAEDVRTYKFPPLEKAISAPTKGVDGDSDKSNKLVSNDALIESMDEYVDNMTLEGMDESGSVGSFSELLLMSPSLTHSRSETASNCSLWTNFFRPSSIASTKQ